MDNFGPIYIDNLSKVTIIPSNYRDLSGLINKLNTTAEWEWFVNAISSFSVNRFPIMNKLYDNVLYNERKRQLVIFAKDSDFSIEKIEFYLGINKVPFFKVVYPNLISNYKENKNFPNISITSGTKEIEKLLRVSFSNSESRDLTFYSGLKTSFSLGFKTSDNFVELADSEFDHNRVNINRKVNNFFGIFNGVIAMPGNIVVLKDGHFVPVGEYDYSKCGMISIPFIENWAKANDVNFSVVKGPYLDNVASTFVKK